MATLSAEVESLKSVLILILMVARCQAVKFVALTTCWFFAY